MEQILQMMARVAELKYDVNVLTPLLGDSSPNSFLQGAEEGLDISHFNLDDKKSIELYNKRKESFRLTPMIMGMIQDLSSEDKATLADRVKALTDENRKKFLDSKTIYDNVISIVESPEFSFEGNQEYKQKIINLKEAYKRFDSIAQYYENMYAYIKSFQRSK